MREMATKNVLLLCRVVEFTLLVSWTISSSDEQVHNHNTNSILFYLNYLAITKKKQRSIYMTVNPPQSFLLPLFRHTLVNVSGIRYDVIAWVPCESSSRFLVSDIRKWAGL